MRYVVAVVDLQFGSTGKGQIAGTMAYHWKPDTVATAWGPNAGHTFIPPVEGRKFINRMLASSAHAPSVKNILIGPGTVLDLSQLALEIDAAQDLLQGKHLIIHPQATILRSLDATQEQGLVRIGSTMKGTAEAAIRKMRRVTDVVAHQKFDEVYGTLGQAMSDANMSLAISSKHYDRAVDQSERLIVEGAQGFSLGIHTDFFPYTTSRDVSTSQLFADCRLPFPLACRGMTPLVHVIGVARTYPIRVANRFNEKGEQVGTSGGHYPDQTEISWGDLDREPELTTVTKLPRRVFSFSMEQIREAVRICTPTTIALTFCDYLKGDNVNVVEEMASKIQGCGGAPVRLLSYGPTPDTLFRRLLPTKDLKPVLETNSDWLMGW